MNSKNDKISNETSESAIATTQSRNHIVTNSSVPTQSRNHQILSAITSRMETAPTDIVLYRDAFDCLRNIEQEMGERDVKLSADLKKRLRAGQLKAKESGDRAFQTGAYEVNRKILCWEAPVLFDSYMLYMEMNRPFEKQFYMPRRKQMLRAVNAMQDLSERKLKLLGISMPPGVGKALADDTPILTRNGWKNHGDLVVGDEVIGLNGEFKKVIAVHPKCFLDVLVEFTNGEKIQCHENHEWMLHDRSIGKTFVKETKEYENRKLSCGGEPGHRGHRYIFQLPRKEYVVGEEKNLPVDPYLLGVWLGDGANKNPRISNAKCDKAIIDKIVEHGYEIRWSGEHKQTGVVYYDFDIRTQLRSFGMCHSKKKTKKHIPPCYLTASVEQRLELLAGLIDTDGCRAGRKYQYSSCDQRLISDIVSLVSTFGWRACVHKEEPHISTSGIVGKHCVYIVSFSPDLYIPCALERKQLKEFAQQRRIAVKSITRVTPKQGNCITVAGDGMYLAGRTLLPTHNTTLALFFLTWEAGRHPDQPMLTGSHNKDFLAGTYGECLRLLDPKGDYLWNDVFPELKVTQTNAKTLMIDIGGSDRDRKRFMTMEFSSVGSGNAGKVRAQNLLYCDDLVDGIETALSKDRLDKLWGMYTDDLRQRKIGDCAELHIATRWSVHDIIGRLEQKYGHTDTAKFIVMPALDENDESNFNYPIPQGFTTAFYREQRDIMDDASWRALYMNEPIEREGQLYAENELRYYFELPDREPDAILAVCDTKDRGSDYCVMPIAYQYGQDYYIDKVVCENYAPTIVDEQLIMALVDRKVQMCQFESNSAGGKTAEKVQKGVKEKGGITRITTRWTTANKETKIIVNSPWVKEHCLFKDNSVIKDDKEYREFKKLLHGYTMAGNNKHDDVPDAMAQFALFVQNLSTAQVSVQHSPFR